MTSILKEPCNTTAKQYEVRISKLQITFLGKLIVHIDI